MGVCLLKDSRQGESGMPRILMVTNQWPSDRFPYRIIVSRQVDGLRAIGVAVDVLVIAGHESGWNYARAMVRMLRICSGPRKYDVIHAHTGHCGAVALCQLKYPVVLSYVGYDLENQAAGYNLRYTLELFRSAR